jgi:hypothetical protein
LKNSQNSSAFAPCYYRPEYTYSGLLDRISMPPESTVFFQGMPPTSVGKNVDWIEILCTHTSQTKCFAEKL